MSFDTCITLSLKKLKNKIKNKIEYVNNKMQLHGMFHFFILYSAAQLIETTEITIWLSIIIKL